MDFRQASRNWKLLVAALYAVAMLSVAFAHKVERRAANDTIDLAAYALPDGTLPIICGDQNGPPIHGESGNTFCDACRLCSAPGLDVPVAITFAPALGFIDSYFRPASNRSRRVITIDAPQPRGPPRFV